MKELEKTIRLERIGDRTRRWLLATHALGLTAVGCGFIYDYTISGKLANSPVYSKMVENPYYGIPWMILPVAAGLFTVYGVVFIRRRIKFMGLVATASWYAVQVIVFIVGALQGKTTLLAPLMIYSAILLPVTVIHILGVGAQVKVEDQ